jgi:hypothetical protein
MLSGPEAALLSIPLVWLYRACTGIMNGLNLWWFQKMVKLALDAAFPSKQKQAKAA